MNNLLNELKRLDEIANSPWEDVHQFCSIAVDNLPSIINLLEAGEKLRGEMAAIEEEADDELGEWAAVEILYVPTDLQALKTISSATERALSQYDNTVRELEGK